MHEVQAANARYTRVMMKEQIRRDRGKRREGWMRMRMEMTRKKLYRKFRDSE
jgi:hypothetical protein